MHKDSTTQAKQKKDEREEVLKEIRQLGLYRQAVSEPCRHHPALGQRGRQESGPALSKPGLQRKGG